MLPRGRSITWFRCQPLSKWRTFSPVDPDQRRRYLFVIVLAALLPVSSGPRVLRPTALPRTGVGMGAQPAVVCMVMFTSVRHLVKYLNVHPSAWQTWPARTERTDISKFQTKLLIRNGCVCLQWAGRTRRNSRLTGNHDVVQPATCTSWSVAR